MRNLTFFKGTVDSRVEPGESFTAGIDVFDPDATGQGTAPWLSRIEIHGDTAAEAEELRDHVLTLLTADKETADA